MTDLRHHIEFEAQRHALESWWRPRGLDRAGFVDLLATRSEGNTQYIHHVLRELRDGGIYQDENADHLPHGLTHYYCDYWQQSRERCGQEWTDYHLPVLATLAIVDRPISLQRIQLLSQIEQPARVLAVLLHWKAFLYHEEDSAHNLLHQRFGLTQATFIDFLHQRRDPDLLQAIQQVKELRRRLLAQGGDDRG